MHLLYEKLIRAVTSSSLTTVACKTPAKKIHNMVQNKSQREFLVSMDTFHLVAMVNCYTIEDCNIPGIFGIQMKCLHPAVDSFRDT